MALIQKTYREEINGAQCSITHNVETGEVIVNANVNIRMNQREGEWTSQTPSVLPSLQSDIQLRVLELIQEV